MSDTDCLSCRHPRAEHLPGRPSFCTHDNDDGWTRYDKVKRCDCLGYITYEEDPRPRPNYGPPPLEYETRRLRPNDTKRHARAGT